MRIFCSAVLSATALLAACGGSANKPENAAPNTQNVSPTSQSNSSVPGSSTAKGEALSIVPGTGTQTFVVSRKNDRVQAGFTSFAGTFDLVDGKAEGSSLTIEVDTNTLFSEDASLTEQMKGPDFLDTAKFPKASFKSTKIEDGARPPDNSMVTGDLEIRGQTRSVTFPARIVVSDADVTFKTGFRVFRKDYGFTSAGAGENPIRDDISIMLDFKAPRNK